MWFFFHYLYSWWLEACAGRWFLLLIPVFYKYLISAWCVLRLQCAFTSILFQLVVCPQQPVHQVGITNEETESQDIANKWVCWNLDGGTLLTVFIEQVTEPTYIPATLQGNPEGESDTQCGLVVTSPDGETESLPMLPRMAAVSHRSPLQLSKHFSFSALQFECFIAIIYMTFPSSYKVLLDILVIFHSVRVGENELSERSRWSVYAGDWCW